MNYYVVQSTGTSTVAGGHVAVLRPTITVNSSMAINSSTASSPVVISSPKQLNQHQLNNSLLSHHQPHRLQLSNTNGVYSNNSNRVQQQNVHSSDNMVTASSIASVHTTINNGPMFRWVVSSIMVHIIKKLQVTLAYEENRASTIIAVYLIWVWWIQSEFCFVFPLIWTLRR